MMMILIIITIKMRPPSQASSHNRSGLSGERLDQNAKLTDSQQVRWIGKWGVSFQPIKVVISGEDFLTTNVGSNGSTFNLQLWKILLVHVLTNGMGFDKFSSLKLKEKQPPVWV